MATRTSGLTPILYATVQGMMWKFQYSIGVNWQLNQIEYKDLSVGKKDRNTQWGLNPKVQVMLPLGKEMKHALMLVYQRLLNDIPYSAISSVVKWDDAYNYTVGNPDLKAKTDNMVMLGIQLFRNKLNLTGLYGHSHNVIHWVTRQSEENPNVFYTQPTNVGGQDAYAVGIEWNSPVTKWWMFKLSGRLEIFPEDITISGVHYGKTRLKEYFSMNHNFNFKGGWGGMLNGSWEPTYHNLDRTYHAVYDLNGRIYKDFLGKKLRVAMKFVACGNRRKLDREVGDEKVSFKYTSPVQRIGVSLSWNFSGGKDVNVNAITDGNQSYQETSDAK